MISTYRSVFRTPGTLAFCLSGVVMRAPLAMYPLGIVLFISAQTGRYGLAGALAGTYTIANGVVGPLLSRTIDRRGQSAVLLPAAILHVAAVVGLIAAVALDAPSWVLFAPATVMGASYLNVASLVRARWTHMLSGRPELGTAYSLESVLDEVLFVVCPVIITLLALVYDSVGLAIAAVLVGVGSVLLRARRDTEPPAHPLIANAAKIPSPIRMPALRWLSLSMLCIGGIFGSAEVSMVAFAGERDQRAASGFLLGCFAAGSMVAGLIYGSRTWKRSVRSRFALQATIFGLAQPLFLIMSFSLPSLAVTALVVSLGTAPSLITGFGMIESIVPNRALTEGLTWAGTGIAFGFAIASSAVGLIADQWTARSGFVLSIVFGVGLIIASQITVRLVREHLADPTASEPVPVTV